MYTSNSYDIFMITTFDISFANPALIRGVSQ